MAERLEDLRDNLFAKATIVQKERVCVPLKRLSRIRQLQNISGCERYKTMSVTASDYRKIAFEEDSVVYCDIPYIGINGSTRKMQYNNGEGGFSEFVHSEFFDWACKQDVPVFISSYNIPDPRFECVLEIDTISTMEATGPTRTFERVYVPKGKVQTCKQLLLF